MAKRKTLLQTCDGTVLFIALLRRISSWIERDGDLTSIGRAVRVDANGLYRQKDEHADHMFCCVLLVSKLSSG